MLRPSLNRRSEFSLALRAAFRHFDRSDDEYFFAETLSGDFTPISTAGLNRSLERYQIGFATYLDYTGFDPAYAARDRATMADRLDLTDGAYRYALFVKHSGNHVVGGAKVPAPDGYPVAVAGRRKVRSSTRGGGCAASSRACSIASSAATIHRSISDCTTGLDPTFHPSGH